MGACRIIPGSGASLGLGGGEYSRTGLQPEALELAFQGGLPG